jgi:hypothetical protein
MFVGAYWTQREESKEVVAERIATFLTTLAENFERFATWFSKAKSRAAALRSPLTIDSAAVMSKLSVNRRDDNRQPIPELGFRLALWNGDDASFSATMGSYSSFVGNSVVLDIDESAALSVDAYRIMLDEMVRIFTPDHAVVTNDEHLARTGATEPWEAGWLTYERGREIREHPFP